MLALTWYWDGELNYIYRIHAIERMFEREISEENVEKVISIGDIIETYPNDQPYISYLVLGFLSARAIHVVYAKDEDSNIIVITVYEPNLQKWSKGFRRRNK